MGGIVISCASWVINVKKIRREGGLVEVKRRMAKQRVSVYMMHVAQYGGKGRRGSRLLNFAYQACVSTFRTMHSMYHSNSQLTI